MIRQLALVILPYSDRLLKIGIIALATLFIVAVTDMLFHRFLTPHAPSKRAKTLLSVISNAFKIVVFALAVVLCLSVWRIDITPILASAGIVGLAVGFGSQVLVKDIISGIFLIFENQFNAGDVVLIGDIRGVVESIGLRTISVRDETGALHLIPNGSITQLANLSDRWSSAVIKVAVATTNNVDTVKKELEAIGEAMYNDSHYNTNIVAKPKVFALDELSDSKMTFKVVIKTSPGKNEGIEQHFRYLTKKQFDKAKISFS